MLRKLKCITQAQVAPRRENESGNVAVVFVICFLTLLAFMGLAIDSGGVYQMRSKMMSTAELARDISLDSAVLTRNSATPGTDLAINITRVLRNNGYEGKIKISYYELNPMQIKGVGTTENWDERQWCVYIEMEQTYDTKFMQVMGWKHLYPQVGLMFNDKNTTNTKVWKPGSDESSGYVPKINNLTYTIEAGKLPKGFPVSDFNMQNVSTTSLGVGDVDRIADDGSGYLVPNAIRDYVHSLGHDVE